MTTIINGRARSQKYTHKKNSLVAMTSEFKLPLEGCHENLSAKFKVKTPQLNEKDCHSVESSIQRWMSLLLNKYLEIKKKKRC